MNESEREMDVIVTIILQEYFEEWIAPLMIFDVEMISVKDFISFFYPFALLIVLLSKDDFAIHMWYITITDVIIYTILVVII